MFDELKLLNTVTKNTTRVKIVILKLIYVTWAVRAIKFTPILFESKMGYRQTSVVTSLCTCKKATSINPSVVNYG